MDIDPHSLSTEDARAELEEAVRWFGELGDEAGLATTWNQLATLEFTPCRFDHAERAARKALDHARRCGEERLVSQALIWLVGAQRLGRTTPEEGRRTLDELHEELPRTRLLEAVASITRAGYFGMEGFFDEARRLMNLALETVQALGLGYPIGVSLGSLGELELLAGDAIAAERACRRSYEIFDEQGDEAIKSTTAAYLARSLCELGRIEEAEKYAAIARAAAAEDDLMSQALGRSVQALVRSARGEHAAAEMLASEAIRLFSDAECPDTQGDLRMDLAAVLRAAGKPTEAMRVASEALLHFDRKGNRVASQRVRTFLAEPERSHP
jgi:tetratricopeptide (TPR) repeat protein